MWKACTTILHSLQGKSFQTLSSQSRCISPRHYNLLIRKLEKENANLVKRITDLEQRITNSKNTIKDKNRLVQILCVGELAQNVQILIRLTIFRNMIEKNKIEKITSVFQLDKLIETHDKYLTQEEIKKWKMFRQKIEDGTIPIKQVNDAFQRVSQWMNEMEHPKTSPISLPLSKSDIID